jgi:hypothetical protein
VDSNNRDEDNELEANEDDYAYDNDDAEMDPPFMPKAGKSMNVNKVSKQLQQENYCGCIPRVMVAEDNEFNMYTIRNLLN